jgi:integrase
MRKLNRLSARAVATIEKTGRHADGGGLYLQIKNGGRSWIFIYRDRATNKQRNVGFGSINSVPLGEARQFAAAARLMLAKGIDPLADKKAKRAALKKAQTFGDYCDEFLKSALAGFNNEKHRYQWRATLTNDAAALRPILLRDITTDDVRKVLEPIWHKKHETARRLRQRIERVLDAAKAAGLREGDNPARWKGNLQPFFGSQKRAKAHLPAIPYPEMPAFMSELRERSSTSARALEFTILTAARSGEVRGATWGEIDLEEKLWIVPAERMKTKRLHRVPLTSAAIALLTKLTKGKPNQLIFAGKEGNPFSDTAMLECLRDLRCGVTVHGFRSSFRDWVGDETSFPREIAEAALAHTIEDSTEAAYRRSDALRRRRDLMELWDGYLANDRGKIISISGAKRS